MSEHPSEYEKEPASPIEARAGVAAPVPVAPPTVRGSAPSYRRRANWPSVLGIITIVVGGLGALLNLYNAVSVFLMPAIFDAMSSMPGQASTVQAMRDFLPTQSMLSAVGACIAAVLIVGGSLLVKRHPLGPRLIQVWALIKIPLAVATCLVMFFMQSTQFASMARAGGPPQVLMSSLAAALALLYLLWLIVLPVIVLVWFARGATRDEIAAWRSGVRPPEVARS